MLDCLSQTKYKRLCFVLLQLVTCYHALLIHMRGKHLSEQKDRRSSLGRGAMGSLGKEMGVEKGGETGLKVK